MQVLWRQIGVFIAALLCAVALLAYSSAAWGQTAEDAIDEDLAGNPYAAGELIVTHKPEAPPSNAAAVGSRFDARTESTLPDIDARLLEFPEVKNQRSQEAREDALERIKQALEQNPGVESVDYNYIFTISYTPNDPRFKRQWGFKKTGFERAWNRTRGAGVRVAVVDTGAVVRHEDLQRKIAGKRDLVNKDATVEDRSGHGTHVAGTVAARTGNKKGVAGGCPRCKLLVAKVLKANGSGEASDIARGINWSTNKGAKVINLSFGGPHVDAVRKAVDRATDEGVVVVAAVGNYEPDRPRTVDFPAAYPNVIAVAATTKKDRRASFSKTGEQVDVAAPGVGILSTVPGGYESWGGTSMATPHVSALAGLLASQGRNSGVIRSRILNTALDLGSEGPDPDYGNGRIRANLAVK